MRFKLLLPTEILIEQPIQKIVAESAQGSFCLLPRHRDWTTALIPGLLSFVDQKGQESFVAVDEGILVKCGDEVLVSTQRATTGLDLGQLRMTVEEQFLLRDAHEERARSVLMRLEALFMQRFAKK
ncbi:MAG: F0F1 ATP synthase subunit epsilon [Myxococcales bacterium]|nr:F0F1 ATP synthase subunit epsilon [Myxococcales bacterium]MCB9641573.1 F0F1 ATP synthase subunit epsilon [Myxococcales bacterium]